MRLPVNTQLSFYDSFVRPNFRSNWQYRAQMQFMFQKLLLRSRPTD